MVEKARILYYSSQYMASLVHSKFTSNDNIIFLSSLICQFHNICVCVIILKVLKDILFSFFLIHIQVFTLWHTIDQCLIKGMLLRLKKQKVFILTSSLNQNFLFINLYVLQSNYILKYIKQLCSS